MKAHAMTHQTIRTTLVAVFALLLGCASAEVKPTAVSKPAVDPAAQKAAADAVAKQKLLATPGAPDAEFRNAKPPAASGNDSFKAPVPVEKKLKNGARLLVVENHAVPLVAIDIAIPAGADVVPLDKTGLDDFTATMLDEGTLKHGSLELAAAIDDLALNLSSTAGPETMHLTINSLSETLPQALDLMAEVLMQPAFRPEDVERVRDQLLTALLQKYASPPAVASDQLVRMFYGAKHPLGQPNGGTPETIKAITTADLKKFHDIWYRPNGAVIGVSGDVNLSEIQAMLETRLAGWKPKTTAKPKLTPVWALPKQVVLVDKADASQSQVWVVGKLFPAKDPDAIAVTVANNVVGGLFNSRINQNLRETKSWSYGVRSRVSLRRNDGWILTSGGIQAPFTAEALGEYYKELDGFTGGELREGELDRAKEAMIRLLPSALETNSAVAASLTTLALNGLPLDYFATLPAKVAKIDAKEIARVAKKYFSTAKMPAVVVGPKALCQEKLTAMKVGEIINP